MEIGSSCSQPQVAVSRTAVFGTSPIGFTSQPRRLQYYNTNISSFKSKAEGKGVEGAIVTVSDNRLIQLLCPQYVVKE